MKTTKNVSFMAFAQLFHSKKRLGADLGEVCGVCAPLPEMTRDFLIQLYTKSAVSFDTYFQQITLCYCLVKSLLRFFVFAFKICLRRQSVTPLLSGAPPS